MKVDGGLEVLTDYVHDPEDDDYGGVELGVLEQILKENRHGATLSVYHPRGHSDRIEVRKSLDSLEIIVNATGSRATEHESRMTYDAV